VGDERGRGGGGANEVGGAETRAQKRGGGGAARNRRPLSRGHVLAGLRCGLHLFFFLWFCSKLQTRGRKTEAKEDNAASGRDESRRLLLQPQDVLHLLLQL
jgi:hypothetical protein